MGRVDRLACRVRTEEDRLIRVDPFFCFRDSAMLRGTIMRLHRPQSGYAACVVLDARVQAPLYIGG